jgi:ABC-type antimicrobial peptide transport system permease subunit
MLLVAAGIAVGIPSALASSRLLSSWLFGLKANDPVTLSSATVLLAAVAALAAYIPARKAARVDPLLALRHE